MRLCQKNAALLQARHIGFVSGCARQSPFLFPNLCNRNEHLITNLKVLYRHFSEMQRSFERTHSLQCNYGDSVKLSHECRVLL